MTLQASRRRLTLVVSQAQNNDDYEFQPCHGVVQSHGPAPHGPPPICSQTKPTQQSASVVHGDPFRPHMEAPAWAVVAAFRTMTAGAT